MIRGPLSSNCVSDSAIDEYISLTISTDRGMTIVLYGYTPSALLLAPANSVPETLKKSKAPQQNSLTLIGIPEDAVVEFNVSV